MNLENRVEYYLNLLQQEISDEERLKIMDIIDELKIQKELLEIEAGTIKLADIKKAARRLGKKSQSAFETKI
jgi:AAA+ ATPase superfamily predicted ATPase